MSDLAQRLREVAVIAVRGKRSSTQHEMADAVVVAVLRELADDLDDAGRHHQDLSYVNFSDLRRLADSIAKGGKIVNGPLDPLDRDRQREVTFQDLRNLSNDLRRHAIREEEMKVNDGATASESTYRLTVPVEVSIPELARYVLDAVNAGRRELVKFILELDRQADDFELTRILAVTFADRREEKESESYRGEEASGR